MVDREEVVTVPLSKLLAAGSSGSSKTGVVHLSGNTLSSAGGR